ncbi:hypothetical protein ACA910_014896 [Epithemia clementina (nom. ined.)]
MRFISSTWILLLSFDAHHHTVDCFVEEVEGSHLRLKDPRIKHANDISDQEGEAESLSLPSESNRPCSADYGDGYDNRRVLCNFGADQHVMTLTNVIGSTAQSDAVDVAMAGNFLVIGERRLGDGLVQSHFRAGEESAFSLIHNIELIEGSRNFGDSVDLAVDKDGNPSMVIGASRTFHESIPGVVTGSAHFLQYDGNSWNEVGGPIRSDEKVPDTVGLFGGAVALASYTRRIAVGAPSAGLLKAGKVYTFEYNANTTRWDKMAKALTGDGANCRMGTSVDINGDGTRLLVGAPGYKSGAGQVRYYEWNTETASWDNVFTLSGKKTQGMGAAVRFIREDGSAFIVGAPVYGPGMVQVYVEEKDDEDSNSTSTNTTTFVQRGNTISGTTSGEQVGSTVCGKKGRIAFGTALGSFHVYGYNKSSDTWEPVADNIPVKTGSDGVVVSIDMSDDGQSVSVGLELNQVVQVYDLLSKEENKNMPPLPHEQNVNSNITMAATSAPSPFNVTLSEGEGDGNETVPSPSKVPSPSPPLSSGETATEAPTIVNNSSTSAPTTSPVAGPRPPGPSIVTPDLFTDDFSKGGSFIVLIVLLALAIVIFICLACGWC